MQSNIINMFSPEITSDTVCRALGEKIRYIPISGISYPVSHLNGVTREEDLIQSCLIPLLETTIAELQNLQYLKISFMQKFESILRIVYRSNRNNPELILLYQEISCRDGGDGLNSVILCFRELHRQVRLILKNQAYSDGVILEEGVMEDLIFFMLDQILHSYQQELAGCCRNLMDGENEPFPSEDEMIDRFYTPLAEQLKGLIAS